MMMQTGRPDAAAALREGLAALRGRWPVAFGLVAASAAIYVILQFTGPKASQSAPSSMTIAWRFGVMVTFLLIDGWLSMALVRLVLDGLDSRTSPVRRLLAEGLRGMLILLPLGVILQSPYWVTPFLSVPTYWRVSAYVEFSAFLLSLASIALWGVLATVVVSERLDLFRGFARAYRLGRRGRWPLVWAYILLRAVAAVIFTLAPLTILRLGFWSTELWTVVYVGLRIGQMAMAMVYDVFAVAYYRQLCRLHDGVAPSEVAGLFD